MARRASGTGRVQRRTVKWIRIRLGILAVFFAIGVAVLGGRAVDLQYLQAGELKRMAEDQTLREMVLTPTRGKITDRNGEDLALSVDVESIRADPSRVPDKRAISQQLGRVLHIDAGSLEHRLSKGRYFAWVKRRVSPEEARAVKALKLAGVSLTHESRRFYPHRELASHILGFAGIDGHGLDGLELALDDHLVAERLSTPAVRDARGYRLMDDAGLDPTQLEGGSATLTLDRTIQWITEKALQEAVDEAQAKAGMAIVIDPRTGAILASASRPTYNPNAPGESDRGHRRNRVFTDVYEPGSTFKALSIALALEAGVVESETTFDCESGAARIGGHTIHDSHHYDLLTVSEILKVSSNIGSAKIASRLGKEGLVTGLARFGIGSRWGIGLPGERTGRLRPASSLSDVGLATVSFGQGVSTTPLQVAAAISAFGNQGKLMKPYLIQKVVDARGNTVISRKPEVAGQVVRPEVAAEMLAMMESVVGPGGTAPRARLDGYRVAGKTGTSQKVDPLTRGYSQDKRVGSFVGLVPAEAPRLTILVVIDEPQGVKYGGVVAAPAFRKIAEQSLRYLGVPATATESDLEDEPPIEATALAEMDAAEAEGYLLPSAIEPPPEGKTLVPDLRGKDIRTAIVELAERHLEAMPRGTGVVQAQHPPPGAVAGPGETIELTLAIQPSDTGT